MQPLALINLWQSWQCNCTGGVYYSQNNLYPCVLSVGKWTRRKIDLRKNKKLSMSPSTGVREPLKFLKDPKIFYHSEEWRESVPSCGQTSNYWPLWKSNTIIFPPGGQRLRWKYCCVLEYISQPMQKWETQLFFIGHKLVNALLCETILNSVFLLWGLVFSY